MTLPILVNVRELRTACDEIRGGGETLALVPTMGALHEGHLSLIRLGCEVADKVIVTIFVNPTQFAPDEDFALYPRNLDDDVAKSKRAGASAVFAPATEVMYPPGDATRVRVAELSRYLCGVARPHHFEGVATVVTKLFAATGPCSAVFGKKDYQQLKIVQRLVTDLLLPVTIVPGPIHRHQDGVAMSSRNEYLAPVDRQRARALVVGLSSAARAFEGGEVSVRMLRQLVEGSVVDAALELDYATLADPETLVPLADDEKVRSRTLLAVAARVGPTRLIDNLVLGEDPDPLARGSQPSPS